MNRASKAKPQLPQRPASTSSRKDAAARNAGAGGVLCGGGAQPGEGRQSLPANTSHRAIGWLKIPLERLEKKSRYGRCSPPLPAILFTTVNSPRSGGSGGDDGQTAHQPQKVG